jgi:hypothetical protein
MRGTTGCVALLATLILAGCGPSVPDARASNPEKYDKDHGLCQAQVDDYMRGQRNVDQSRRDVFSGERDRFGQGALPAEMDDYSDSKATDRMMADCMAQRGWPQPPQQWWQRGPIKL